ncbi:hypothetical protein AVE30378_06387 [Achromobacter veterisilvae]|jgi:transposase|uniref:Uncharacterized protein n=1 Tax=Achromobacter veterisilvae TaxID=2069367 RepID=A0A446D1S8_9BURK|nr:IS110 family transposase [Achromobacter veterisilvae]SSW74033.1 hypothetical protein AVE30378_06387 [Achromobacter veterisilvae]
MQIAVSFFGADVGKSEVVVADHGRAKPVTQILKNTPASLSKWLQTLPQGSVLAMESTGGYERMLADLAYERGLKVYVLNPKALHHYAKSLGQRGKTDRLDAIMIARFIASEHERLHPYQPSAQHIERLRKILRLRKMAVVTRTQLRLSSERHHQVHAQAQVQKVLDALTELANSLEDQMLAEIQAEPALAQDFKLLTSIVGVGNLTATALVTTFARIPFTGSDAVVAYAGLDPRPKESGAYKGMRKLSKQGDAILRSLAYNAATAAARSITFKPMYQALLAKGWATTQALNIIARKLLRIAFGVWKSRKPFDQELFLAKQACVKP